MTGKNFQAIYDKLSSTITEYWEKLIFRADYGHDNWSMMFYLVQEDGIIKDCYSMKGASRDKLIKLFIEINAELQEWRKIRSGCNYPRVEVGKALTFAFIPRPVANHHGPGQPRFCGCPASWAGQTQAHSL